MSCAPRWEYNMNKQPKKLRVCVGPHCSFRGSHRILEVLEKFFGVQAGVPNEKVDLDVCRCTDNCDWGPNVVEDDKLIYNEATTKDIAERITRGEGKPMTPLSYDDLKLDEDLV